MTDIKIAAVSRNYFNMPLWIADHTGLFEAEGLGVAIELHEPINAVTERLVDGRVQLALGVTEHAILDRERGGQTEIIGGNVNKLPFCLIGAKHITDFEDLRGGTIGVSSIKAGSSSLVIKLLEARGLSYPDDYALREVGPILARWELLQSGEIDAGLQGAPMDYIAIDEGYTVLCNPREEVPEFQFVSLHVDRRWAAANENHLHRFMKAFVAAHKWFYENRTAATEIAVQETGVETRYAERAWDEFTRNGIFPPDGDVSTGGVQALIEISALIRALPGRGATHAESYINRAPLQMAQAALSGG